MFPCMFEMGQQVLVDELAGMTLIDLTIAMYQFLLKEKIADALDEKGMPTSHLQNPCYFGFCERHFDSLGRQGYQCSRFIVGERLKVVSVEDIKKRRTRDTAMVSFVQRHNGSCDIRHLTHSCLCAQESKELGVEMLVEYDIIESIQ